MLKRAIWVSLAIHLAVLLTISRVVLQPYSQRIGATLAMRAPSVIGRELANEGGRKAPEARLMESAPQASLKRPVLPRPARGNFNFGRFLPSTVGSSAQLESVLPPPTALQLPTDQSIPASFLGQFRLDLARNARPYKSYPAAARENGWEGRVVISVAYPFGKGAPLTSVEESSGHALLDRQALDMVERALTSMRLPDALQGRAFAVSLPIEYRLAE